MCLDEISEFMNNFTLTGLIYNVRKQNPEQHTEFNYTNVITKSWSGHTWRSRKYRPSVYRFGVGGSKLLYVEWHIFICVSLLFKMVLSCAYSGCLMMSCVTFPTSWCNAWCISEMWARLPSVVWDIGGDTQGYFLGNVVVNRHPGET